MGLSGSTLLLLVILQATFAFALAAVILFLFNRKLKRRAKELTERLSAQNKLHKQTVNTLKSKLIAQKERPPAPPAETVEVPGGEYSGLLNKNILETEQRLSALGAEPNAEFQLDDSAEIIAARMRHAFIESEKQVLAFSTDPELMWETLQPNLDKITIGLRRHSAALMRDDMPDNLLAINNEAAGDTAELKDKLATLESRWLELETQARASLNALEENYTTLTHALVTQKAGNSLHVQTDTLANHFLEMLSHITADEYPQKDYQVQLASAEDITDDDIATGSPQPDQGASSTTSASQPEDPLIDAQIDALADSLVDAPTANDSLTQNAQEIEALQYENDSENDLALEDFEALLNDTNEPDLDDLILDDTSTNDDTRPIDPPPIEVDLAAEQGAAMEKADSNAAENDTSNESLTDDIDALLAETNALLAEDDEDDYDGDDGDDGDDDLYGNHDNQLDALDEEFLALAGEVLSESEDNDPTLLTEAEDEPVPPAQPTSTNEPPLNTADTVENPADLELDPDAIIAAALAETESAEDGDTADPMDDLTFEDLLADNGVDLDGDLSAQ